MPKRGFGSFRCSKSAKRWLQASGLRHHLQAGALVFIGLVMSWHLSQAAHQGQTFVRIFLGHGINVELKPVFGFLSNQFGHSYEWILQD
ncbi:MAG TPA: hypothetical protein VN708_15010 [Terriglobales bacterium]|nr:hypothetical protein [Terriglobales bacterium]